MATVGIALFIIICLANGLRHAGSRAYNNSQKHPSKRNGFWD